MKNREFPELDLDASFSKLTEWVKERRTTNFDHAQDSRRHVGMAKRLLSLAAELGGDEWFYLECEFDRNPPAGVGADGYPIPYTGDNAGSYKALCWNLHRLAETAEQMANQNPKPRTKPWLELAADFFLHLWYDAGKRLPKLYDKHPAVTAFSAVLSNAGNPLSIERVRGLLGAALEKFDPLFCLDDWQLDRIKVFHQ